MRAIKKINNNVAICLDGNGKELIAFGNGIGFPQIPYEITDMRRIQRTFYDVDERYRARAQDMPAEILSFSARMFDYARSNLPYEINTNLVLTLADHIAFAVERVKKSIVVQMPLANEIEQTYPVEADIGKYILQKMKKELSISLPLREAYGIALTISSARMT